MSFKDLTLATKITALLLLLALTSLGGILYSTHSMKTIAADTQNICAPKRSRSQAGSIQSGPSEGGVTAYEGMPCCWHPANPRPLR